MSRSKKTRSGANNSEVIRVRERTESELEGRLRKKQNKRKGLQSGARQGAGVNKRHQQLKQMQDPRLGSKKPIQLVVSTAQTPSGDHQLNRARKELEQLENDAHLMVLLDRLDKGEKLGSGLQNYVNEKLDRIEELMGILGIEDESELIEESLPASNPEPKKNNKNKSTPLLEEDELLERFNNLNLETLI